MKPSLFFALVATVLLAGCPAFAQSQSITPQGTSSNTFKLGVNSAGANTITLNNNAGVAEVNNPGNTGQVILRVAAPAGSSDAVNKAYGDGHVGGYVLTLGTSGQCLYWTGSAVNTAPCSGGGGSVPTGTGFTHITSGSQDSAARAVNVASADITGTQAVGNGGTGAATLTAHAVLLGEGTSAVGSAGPGTSGQPLLSGGSSADPSYGNLALANLAACSSNQILVTVGGVQTCETVSGSCSNVAGVWTCSGGGGGITALTGDVVASGTGSVAATVEAISGTSPIAVTPNALQWVAGATGPLLTQANSSGAGAPFTIAPQASTGAASGSFVVTLAAPGGGTTESQFEVNRTGGASLGFKSDGSGDAFLSMNGATMVQTQAGRAGMYIGGGITTAGLFMYPGAVTTGSFYATGNVQLLAGIPADFGGGAYVLGIGAANTKPTALPSTAGDVVLYGSPGTGSQKLLGIDTQGIEPDGPAIGAGGSFTIAPSTVASGTGVNLILQAGGTSSGTAGGLAAVSHNGSSGLLLYDTSATLDSNGSLTFDATSSGANVPICLGCANTTGNIVAGSNTSGNFTLTAGSSSLAPTISLLANGAGAINLDAASSGQGVAIGIGNNNTAGAINIGNALASQLTLNPGSGGALALTNTTTTTSASIGSATALPALPQGYMTILINGTAYKIAYFLP